MAKLVEYESNLADQGLRVSDKGVNAEEAVAAGALSTGKVIASQKRQEGSDVAGAIKDVGNVAQQAYQQLVVQPEISKGAALASTKQADLVRQWNDIAAKTDPNDTSVRAKFLNDALEPQLNEFKEAFNTADGKAFADKEANRFREHMTNKVDADMATRSSNALLVNLDKTKNNLSNLVRADPTSYQHAIDTMESSINTLVHNSTFLSADAADRARTLTLQHMRSELATAAILGTAERSPKDAQALLDSGKFNDVVDGAAMSKMIDQFKRAQRVDADYAQKKKDEAEKDRSAEVRDDYIKDIYSDAPKTTMKDVLTHQELLPADREHLAIVIKGQLKPEAQSRVSQATTSELFDRIITSDPSRKLTSTYEIDKAVADGKLKRADRDWLVERFKDAATPEGQRLGTLQTQFFAGMKSSITKANPLLGTVDQSGDQQFYSFQVYTQSRIDEARRKGENPMTLFDPGSPNYIGKPATILQFQKPIAESLADQAAKYARSSNLTGAGKEITGVQYGPVTNPAAPVRPPISGAPAPPTAYPDAQRAADGNWYVQRDGKYFKVKQ